MSAAQVQALRSLAEPIVTGLECDLEEVTVRQAGKRRLVRIAVDHDGGLSLDLVAEVSRALSAVLDESDVLGKAPYVLEVTSPGVDRPLRTPRHWRRAVGRIVEATLRSGDVVTGRVESTDDEAATLTSDAGSRLVSFAEVRRAVVQVEFSRADDVELAEDDDTDDPEQEA